MPNKILIYDCYNPLSLDKLDIIVKDSKPVLPNFIERKITNKWLNNKRKKNLKEDYIAYFVSHKKLYEKVNSEVFLASFKYNYFFNKEHDHQFHRQYNFNPLSSWIILECDDCLIFGNKINYGEKKVSGFGGYAKLEDLVKNKIDSKKWVMRKILEETGKEITKRVKDIYSAGINLHKNSRLHNYDHIFIVNLDGNFKNIQKEFRESIQFSKYLIPVKANPKSLVSFLEGSKWEPTLGCIGGVFNYIGSKFGEDELKKALASYKNINCVRVLK